MSDIPAPTSADALLDVAALYALCEGASPPPWEAGRNVLADGTPLSAHVEGVCAKFYPEDDPQGSAQVDADMTFIAACRLALPAALRRLAAAEGKVGGWQNACDDADNENARLQCYLAAERRRAAALADALRGLADAYDDWGHESAGFRAALDKARRVLAAGEQS